MLTFKQFISEAHLTERVKWDFSRGDDYNKNVAGYNIVNHKTNTHVGHAKTLSGARKSIDKNDIKYGGYAHTAHPIYNDKLGEQKIEDFADEVIQLDELKYPKGFKGSKWDDDKGVVPGSPADKKRDAKEIPHFIAAQKKLKLGEAEHPVKFAKAPPKSKFPNPPKDVF